ncbi:MAG: polysaccharide biosynthesis protein [Oscillospiraceae bacterium]|nr:polysaccharide biosynthesis protein [Oscillospiraceae bacterium]
MKLSLLGSIGAKTRHRKILLMVADFLLISLSYIASWVILMRRIELSDYFLTLTLSGVTFIAVFLLVFLFFGMYGSLWRYAEAHEFIKCLLATLVAAGAFVGITWLWLQPPVVSVRIPITVYFLSSMMAGISTLFLRMAYRAYRTTRTGIKKTTEMKKVMIIGAGETGNAVLIDLYREPERRYEVICFVDDDTNKVGRKIQRIKVEGTTEDIPKLVDRHGIDIIILAIPDASNMERSRITNICAKTKCQLKKVPDLYALVTDATSIVAQITDVSIDDLLGRDVVDVGGNKSEYLRDRVVLITGAGGSIGSELCRQVMAQRPKRLVMVDISENNLYDIQQELLRGRGRRKSIGLVAEVASVRDENKMDLIFERYRPEMVYHAAAHKHVPLMESVPEEAVKNNIFGTLNVARCADRHQVRRFVMISTDKAVNPINVMGATKRVCEMTIQSMAQRSETEFVAVRFGNVLGSNGSVIPLFRDQISAGGPVTVTHPDIIRYFMTISEAVSLVLIAGEMAKGGEIFVLDMGEPVKILDLAESLIRLSGYEPYRDIGIKFVGLRPGEKLFEELLMDEEGLNKTKNQKVFVGAPIEISAEYLFKMLQQLKSLAERNDRDGIMKILHELVPEYGEMEDVRLLRKIKAHGELRVERGERKVER